MAKNQLQDQLAAAGIRVEVPEIEIPEQPQVETVSADADLKRVASEESFMNEIVTIRLATTTDQNAPPFATVTVNSPANRVQIPRGRVVGVKRMFVEVLARMRETRYSQPVRNMADPEAGNEILGQHADAWPFEVIRDPNPLGHAWLERVRAEVN
jgi:hypothetical protein